jgi:hypothetical protein
LVRKLISQAKWDRLKMLIHWLDRAFNHPPVDGAKFRSHTGFLVHVSMTYGYIRPYLKGLFLSEVKWRSEPGAQVFGRGHPEQDEEEDDWASDEAELLLRQLGYVPDAQGDSDEVSSPLQKLWRFKDGAPSLVCLVPRVRFDVQAMQLFAKGNTPIQVIVRPVRSAERVIHGSKDASGEGFGSRMGPKNQRPLIRFGFWSEVVSQTETSNWREFQNIVDSLREDVVQGRLAGTELWIGTDNSTAEASFYKGTSSSPKLNELVLDLRLLAIRGNFVLNLFHIAGTRMIVHGVDGLSRGELQVGALADQYANTVPWHLSPVQRSPSLRGWLTTWLGEDFNLTEPKDWFGSAQLWGDYSETVRPWVWDLPPAAAIEALEELGNGRLKRHSTMMGVVLVPNLMAPEWKRRLCKVTDFHFMLPAGCLPEWPKDMHEGLTVACYLPLLRHDPWDWKRVEFLAFFGRALSRMYKTGDPWAGDCLRQFWRGRTWIAAMPKDVVCNLLHHPSWRRFLYLSP